MNSLIKESAFVHRLNCLFLKHSLQIRTIEYQDYYTIFLFNGCLNVQLLFLIQPELGGACWTDVLDNNNQLPILAIAIEDKYAFSDLNEILEQVYLELSDKEF